MIYTDPHIFGNNDAYSAMKFLISLSASPLMEHVASEADRLTPIFEAASKALQPYDHGHNLSSKRLKDIFTRTAATFGYMSYGQPLMLGEDLLSRLRNFIKENDIDLDYRIVVPPAGSHKDRMFKTATFGFFSLTAKTECDSYPKKIICPFYIVPDAFLHNSDTADLLKEAAQMSYWFNHDYFHQMIYVAFDKGSFENRHSTAPGESCLLPPADRSFFGFDFFAPLSRKFETAWDSGQLSRHYNMATHIEPWAMRFHREVLVAMDDTDSPLSKAVARYMDCYAASQIPSAQTRMTDPALYPQEYAMRLAAFNLVRFAPLDHPLLQDTIQRFKDIAAQCAQTPADLKDAQDIFADIYKTQYTATFYGDGHNRDMFMSDDYGGADGYADKVMDLSARSLKLIDRDTRAALRIARMTPLKFTMFRGDHTLA